MIEPPKSAENSQARETICIKLKGRGFYALREYLKQRFGIKDEDIRTFPDSWQEPPLRLGSSSWSRKPARRLDGSTITDSEGKTVYTVGNKRFRRGWKLIHYVIVQNLPILRDHKIPFTFGYVLKGDALEPYR